MRDLFAHALLPDVSAVSGARLASGMTSRARRLGWI
jgi:hypothetical protein